MATCRQCVFGARRSVCDPGGVRDPTSSKGRDARCPPPGLAAPALLEALPDVVVVADDARPHRLRQPGDPLAARPRARGACAGSPLTVLDARAVPARAHRGLRPLPARRAPARSSGATTQVPALHADGSEVAVELTLSRLDGSRRTAAVAGGVVVAVLRDASTTVRLERQLEVGRYLDRDAPGHRRADRGAGRRRRLRAAAAHAVRRARLGRRDAVAAGRLRRPPRPRRHLDAARRSTCRRCEADTRGRTFVRGEGLPGRVWQRAGTGRRRGPLDRPALPAPGGRPRRRPAHRRRLPGPPRRHPAGRLRAVLPRAAPGAARAPRRPGQRRSPDRPVPRPGCAPSPSCAELADTLQRSLLPSHLPDIPGVQLAARYRAGADGVFVGGDTYDVLPLPDGRWMVLIADVCGTGAEAAAITALTRHTARAAARRPAQPGRRPVRGQHRAAARADRRPAALRHRLLPGPRAARGRRARAGSASPGTRCRCCATPTAASTEIGVPGPPLGHRRRRRRTRRLTVELSAGSTLVLYTDGVTEARDDAGVQFDDEGLLRRARRPRLPDRRRDGRRGARRRRGAPERVPVRRRRPRRARPALLSARGSAGLAGRPRAPPRPAWTPATRAGAGRRRTPPSSRRRASPTASSGRTGSRSRPRRGSRASSPGPARSPSCSLLKAAQPATDDAAQVSRNSAPISSPSDRENSVVRQPPARAHSGESSVGVPADLLLLVGLRALLARLLRLRRPALDQPDGREDVEEELQVLRLPVLHDVDAERRRRHVVAPATPARARWRPAGR